uniref:SET domain-containing protein n=1 Tax=Magallana gigas TaxID=29159 RepID=A0A8W8K244_MAGGI
MAAYSRGKIAKQRISPKREAEFMCRSGLDCDALKVELINRRIGYGVFATQNFPKGSFLVEYVGERIVPKEAEEREKKRKIKHTSYMFYFKWNDSPDDNPFDDNPFDVNQDSEENNEETIDTETESEKEVDDDSNTASPMEVPCKSEKLSTERSSCPPHAKPEAQGQASVQHHTWTAVERHPWSDSLTTLSN